jgi:hypothetical protein
MSDEVSGAIGYGFGTEEQAKFHLSAFNTIVEMMYQMSENPRGIIDLFPNYFLEVVDGAVETGAFDTRQEALDHAVQALADLFAINQRIAFMFATELAEEIGGKLPDSRLMIEPIERRNKDIPMTSEEVFEEAMRIMRNNHSDTTRKDQ